MSQAPRVTPMIHVPDVKAAVDWYKSIGFTVLAEHEIEGEVVFGVVSFGAGWVYFNEGGKPSNADRREIDLYVSVDDVQKAYDGMKGRVDVRSDLEETFYGSREFIIRDLNGFWITFGQDLK